MVTNTGLNKIDIRIHEMYFLPMLDSKYHFFFLLRNIRMLWENSSRCQRTSFCRVGIRFCIMHEALRLHNVAIFGKVRVISDYYLFGGDITLRIIKVNFYVFIFGVLHSCCVIKSYVREIMYEF